MRRPPPGATRQPAPAPRTGLWAAPLERLHQRCHRIGRAAARPSRRRTIQWSATVPSEAARSKPTMNGQRILLIDADGETRRRLHALLTEAGFEVTLAASGLEGLDQAALRSPAVILLDLLLPDLD